MAIEPAIHRGKQVTKAEVIAAIQAEIDSASQLAAGRDGHEAANASWCIHGLERALQIVEQLREERCAEDLQRERFEAWRRSWGDDDNDLARFPASGDYKRRYIASQWDSWQAALTWRATK